MKMIKKQQQENTNQGKKEEDVKLGSIRGLTLHLLT